MQGHIAAKRMVYRFGVVWALVLIIHKKTGAQTNHTSQFRNQVTLTTPLPKAWSAQVDLLQTWSSSQESKSALSDFSRWTLRGWVFYHANARIKLGFGIGYIQNTTEDNEDHLKNNEWRWTLQGTYYFHKIGYTLLARTRIENRNIADTAGTRESVTRFREQIHLLYPFGSKLIRAKIFYGIVADEVFFKTKSKVSGDDVFDRNRFTLGAGYAFTDHIQLELTYMNDLLPREKGNTILNSIQLHTIINNIFWKKKARKQAAMATQ